MKKAMMKKAVALIVALTLVFAFSVSAFAKEIDQDDTNPNTSYVQVTTEVAPAYTVTIPTGISVEFNATKTNFGVVSLSNARLAPGKCVRVLLNASGTLKNKNDASKTIAYQIMSGSSVFSSVDFGTNKSLPLTIDITQAAWNQAAAGDYTDTVTFTVAYTDI